MALVTDDRVSATNNACRTLLREIVGGSEQAGRRWLTASVTRLLATERTSEVLAGAADTLSLEVRLGPRIPDDPARVVALREVQGAAHSEVDLAETVSTLSHELRTPLTSMKSSLNLVLSGETGPVSTDQVHFLDMTMRNINRLERLVSDLLDVSRSGQGEVALYRRETDLIPVLHEAVQMQEAAARHAGLELDLANLPDSLVAHVDPDKVMQILTNVIGNSIKYTRTGGLVRVWLEARPRFHPEAEPSLAEQLAERFWLPLHTFNLVVEDSGVGMSREDQDRVFEPWYRGQEDEGHRVPGAGLGLHITRALVEAHGGRIGLASEPGQGTTVWIRLPQDPASEGLLHGARQLRAMARARHCPFIAVLDGRPEAGRPACPVGQRAGEFLRDQSADRAAGTVPWQVVSLAPDLVATVASDPDSWREAWAAHGIGAGHGEPALIWQFLPWPAVAGNKELISRSAGRNRFTEVGSNSGGAPDTWRQ